MVNTHSLDLEVSSTQYAWVADDAALSITGDISIEFYIKLESLPSAGTDMVVVAKSSPTGNNRSYFVKILPTDKLQFVYFADGSTSTSIEADAVTFAGGDVGVWVHIAITVDVSASTGILYKNGSSIASTVTGTGTSIFDGNAAFAIGCLNHDTSPVQCVDAIVDEVRVYDQIISEATINANMNKEIPSSTTGLVGYWRLNNNYLDETVNGNDLTAVNSPVFSTDIPFIGAIEAVNPAFFAGGATII